MANKESKRKKNKMSRTKPWMTRTIKKPVQKYLIVSDGRNLIFSIRYSGNEPSLDAQRMLVHIVANLNMDKERVVFSPLQNYDPNGTVPLFVYLSSDKDGSERDNSIYQWRVER